MMATRRSLEAAEVRYDRSTLLVSYVNQVLNEEVPRRFGVQRQLLNSIIKRELNLLGHAMRKLAAQSFLSDVGCYQ